MYGQLNIIFILFLLQAFIGGEGPNLSTYTRDIHWYSTVSY